jgi:hypothetical protein
VERKGKSIKRGSHIHFRCANGVMAPEEVMCSSDGTAIDANTIHKMHKKQNKGELKCPDEKQFRT